MALTDYKITDGDITTQGVQSQADKLSGTAAENKRVFDNLITAVVKIKMNGLIDALVTALAGKMAAPDTDGSAGQYLRTDGEGGRYWDTPSGAGDMLMSVYDPNGDGKVEAAAAADSCTGNAATASKWSGERQLSISDADGTNTGESTGVDGSANRVLKLPAVIKAALTGNADTATKLKTARNIGGAAFDGSAPITLTQMGAMPAAGGTFSGAVTHSGKVTMNGQIVLSSADYGAELPAAGTPGRLFFKKV